MGLNLHCQDLSRRAQELQPKAENDQLTTCQKYVAFRQDLIPP